VRRNLNRILRIFILGIFLKNILLTLGISEVAAEGLLSKELALVHTVC
jgi:hypothetical protein